MTEDRTSPSRAGAPKDPPGAVAIIPARLASTRFPEKVLASRTGKTLIQHVYESARASRLARRVVVACDHPRIFDAVAAFGGEAVLTDADHPNGTSRLAEAARALALHEDTVVVNVQGDEPEIEGGLIDAVISSLLSSGAEVATAAAPLLQGEDGRNPNVVKVVLRSDATALYFSRSLLPYPRAQSPTALTLRHVGVYACRAGFLEVYARLAPTPLETTEMLEQLRVLEHGYRIGVAIYPARAVGIDTPDQYEAFVQRWKKKNQ